MPKLNERKIVNLRDISIRSLLSSKARGPILDFLHIDAAANGWMPGDNATAFTVASRGNATLGLRTLLPAERGNYHGIFGHVFHS